MSNRTIRCIIAAINSNGEPDLYFVKVQAEDSDIGNGYHYEAARKAAEADGYEYRMAMDEHDAAGRAILDKFEWDSASVVVAGPSEHKPVSKPKRAGQVVQWSEETRDMLRAQYKEMGYDNSEEQVGAVLTNLRHLCDRDGLDYAAIDKRAHAGYLEETAMKDEEEELR